MVNHLKPVRVAREEIVIPRSRTFIRAGIDDNPYYGPEYKATLQALPPELKAKFCMVTSA